MALPSATSTEQYDQRRLSIGADGSMTGTRVFRVEYPETFEAQSNSVKDGVDSHVLTQTGVNRWDAYPGQARCLAQTAEVSNGGSHRLWTATYTYSDKFDAQPTQAAEINGTNDGLQTQSSPSPSTGDKATEAESRPFQIRSIKRTVQEVLEYDAITGYRITNTAGDPFDPPLMTERTYLGYEITFFKYPANLRWKAPASTPPFGRPDYIDYVNDATFYIFERPHPARTLRVSDASIQLQWDKGASGVLTPVFEVRVELLSKPGGWKRQILNAGLRELTAAGEPLRPILDSSGQPVTDPYPLNSVGAKLTAGNALVYVTAYDYPERTLIELFQ